MLSFALGLVLAQESLFSRVVAHPNVLNGYDDFVRAAELIDEHAFNDYLQWDGYLLRGRSGPEKPACPSDLRETDPELAVRERMVERFGQALDLIPEGNRKAVSDPRDSYSIKTVFPELMPFRLLARLEAARAHVEFAHGRSADATADLIQGILFASKIGVGPLVGHLSGVGDQSILISELGRNLPQLSLDDAIKLHQCADELLNNQGIAANILKRDSEIMMGALDEILRDPSSISNTGQEETLGAIASANSRYGSESGQKEVSNLPSYINGLSDTQREQLKAQVSARLKMQVDQVSSILDGPEGDWLSKIRDLPAPEDGTLAGLIAGMILPSFGGIVEAEARTKIRIQLLKLNAMAIEYRWLNGKLPDRLADFAPEEDRHDPIGGGEFLYRREGDWYTLTSHGFGHNHNISLRGAPMDAQAEGPIHP